ncbi:hypothetical protein DUNSADRAFT_8282 [Dunaliella salina]|uniref:Uncharacterized protein n=1 Tax=Dunaliella salina TaxID=3046 RepID=A0ABQ7HA87_DUNSA|nr:hypothetical protein DUNSADRAFT_8282 [Dunaliella salina]|eukprot:KAF5843766.1 hypothetical protein DUNSADRAFT_8282 [Dunaliella salina]
MILLSFSSTPPLLGPSNNVHGCKQFPAKSVQKALGTKAPLRLRVSGHVAVLVQSQSERATLKPSSEGIASQPSQEAVTLKNDWMEFLQVLQSQSHFTSRREEVLHAYTEVKWALLSFARARTDAIFALDRGLLKKLAQAPLLPPAKGRTERKLANADARLKATYAPDSLSYALAPAQGEASMQDVLRVLWEWSAASPQDIEAHAPGE